jgi:hypothetical protein
VSYTDMLGVTVEEFPTCPECAAEGKPDCYPLAPANWYPFEDLPMWHWMWSSMRKDVAAAVGIKAGAEHVAEVRG